MGSGSPAVLMGPHSPPPTPVLPHIAPQSRTGSASRPSWTTLMANTSSQSQACTPSSCPKRRYDPPPPPDPQPHPTSCGVAGSPKNPPRFTCCPTVEHEGQEGEADGADVRALQHPGFLPLQNGRPHGVSHPAPYGCGAGAGCGAGCGGVASWPLTRGAQLRQRAQHGVGAGQRSHAHHGHPGA